MPAAPGVHRCPPDPGSTNPFRELTVAMEVALDPHAHHTGTLTKYACVKGGASVSGERPAGGCLRPARPLFWTFARNDNTPGRRRSRGILTLSGSRASRSRQFCDRIGTPRWTIKAMNDDHRLVFPSGALPAGPCRVRVAGTAVG
ncbi:hypothetical protein GCM10023335_67380 [Streptomyces siamensis]|uniref:Uncharacterized protein n=1 Tax=Streptomyces siamensis TaxID=1274986 RepID=A0ABP9JGW7_9ACTN